MNKATRELMEYWEVRNYDEIKFRKKKFFNEKKEIKKKYPQKLEFTIND